MAAGVRPTWDVHVRTVDVLAWRQKHGTLAVRGHDLLLSRPRSVAPGEEDNEELVDDVRVGDVEVMLQTTDVDIAVELARQVSM